MTLSVPIIARNVVKLRYPLDRVVRSVVGLADEIIILVDPTSEDDTIDYVFDLLLEINSYTKVHGTKVKMFESAWDLTNISSTGAEFARQTNIALALCECDFILSLQCDEAMHEKDFDIIRSLVSSAYINNVTAYSMVRLYFYGDIDTVRDDWTVPIVRLFKRGTRESCGDAMNTSGVGRVENSDVKIYHYSRIGDPEIISKRIWSLDKLFHSSDKLLSEEELQPYDFSTRNFDCMHRDTVDVGKKDVVGDFSIFTGTHPKAFREYKGE